MPISRCQVGRTTVIVISLARLAARVGIGAAHDLGGVLCGEGRGERGVHCGGEEEFQVRHDERRSERKRDER